MASNKGFIFDMDGVIVHSNPAHKKAIQVFCKKYNREVSDELLENKVYGRTNKEWIPEVFGEVSPEELKKLADEKEQLFRNIFAPEENVVPGIPHFLEQLKGLGVPMAVATSAPVENLDYILSRLGIQEYFTALLDSSHVSIGKPDPEIYLKASNALKKAPGECIIFEDSVSGVEAGLQAGAVVIGVTTTHTEEELSSCHLVIKDFDGLELSRLSGLSPN